MGGPEASPKKSFVAPVTNLTPAEPAPYLKGYRGGQSVSVLPVVEFEPHAQSQALLNALRDQRSRVIDIFRKLDQDLSGAIDKKEWRQIIVFVSKERRDSGEFDPASIDATFDLLDADNSGMIDLKELDELLRAGFETVLARKLQKGAAGEIVLKAENTIELRKGEKTLGHAQYSGGGRAAGGGKATEHARSLRSGSYEIVKEGTRTISNSHKLEVAVDLDADGDGDISAEELAMAAKALRQALNENAVRVIDLFQDWDVNGDGAVSRKEFVTGVTLMGLPGGQAAAALFNEWDADGGGDLQIRELNRVLRRGNDVGGIPKAVREDYCVNISSRRNWSRRKVSARPSNSF